MKAVVVTILGALVARIVLSLIFAFPVMLLWNFFFVGAISGVNEITWLQTWGLMILFDVLFKTHITKKD